jgi:hypothetical protein
VWLVESALPKKKEPLETQKYPCNAFQDSVGLR